jgi:hypothetical protein
MTTERGTDETMTELDQIRYAAFKRGIGWRITNPDDTYFHAAGIAYVRECRDCTCFNAGVTRLGAPDCAVHAGIKQVEVPGDSAEELHPDLLEVADEEGIELSIDRDGTIALSAEDIEHAAASAVEFAWLADKTLHERDAARVQLAETRREVEAERDIREAVQSIIREYDGRARQGDDVDVIIDAVSNALHGKPGLKTGKEALR